MGLLLLLKLESGVHGKRSKDQDNQIHWRKPYLEIYLWVILLYWRTIMTSFDTFKDLNDDLGLNIDTQDINNNKNSTHA